MSTLSFKAKVNQFCTRTKMELCYHCRLKTTFKIIATLKSVGINLLWSIASFGLNNHFYCRHHAFRVFPWYGLQRVHDGWFYITLGRGSSWNLRYGPSFKGQILIAAIFTSFFSGGGWGRGKKISLFSISALFLSANIYILSIYIKT